MVREQATERATGTAQKTISLKVLRSIVIPKIPIDEQLDFVSRLDSLSGQTQKLESIYQQKLSALAELKQSILQKAFSGELTADAANLENVA
jgi:type I restriction enzyme S subunit